MSRNLTSVILDLPFEPDAARTFGGLLFTDDQRPALRVEEVPPGTRRPVPVVGYSGWRPNSSGLAPLTRLALRRVGGGFFSGSYWTAPDYSITVEAGSNALVVFCIAESLVLTRTVTVPPGSYVFGGGGPSDIFLVLATAFRAAFLPDADTTWTFSFASGLNRIRVTCTDGEGGGNFRLDWADVGSTLPPGDFGFRDESAAVPEVPEEGDPWTLTSPDRAVIVTGSGWAGTAFRRITALEAPPDPLSWRPQWIGIEFCADSADPVRTGIGYMLQDEEGVSWTWAPGTGWTETDPDTPYGWKPGSYISQGLPSWPRNGFRLLVRLGTYNPDVTPVFYGARVLARIWSPSGAEETVLRAIIGRLETARVPIRLSLPSDGTDELDLSGVREYAFHDGAGTVVVEPVEIRDLSGSNPTVNLLGTWDPTTLKATLQLTPEEGAELLVDLLIAPSVVRHAGDEYLADARLPAAVITNLRLRRTPAPQYPTTVYDDLILQNANPLTYKIPTPWEVTASLDVVVLAGYDVDVHRAVDAFDRAAGWAEAGNGMRARLRRVGDWTVGDGALQARSPWELSGLLVFDGPDSEVAAFQGTATVTVETADAVET